MNPYYSELTKIGRKRMMQATKQAPLELTKMLFGWDANNTTYERADDFPADFNAFKVQESAIFNDEISPEHGDWRVTEGRLQSTEDDFKVNRFAIVSKQGEMIIFGAIPTIRQPAIGSGAARPNKVKAIICIEANNHDSVVIHLDDEIIGQKMLNVECMNAIARLHIESFHATNKRIALSAALKNSAEKQKQQLAEHEKQASLVQQSSLIIPHGDS